MSYLDVDEPALRSKAPRWSTLALTSLISGILSFLFLPFIGGLVAVVTGHMARRQMREEGGRLEGDAASKIGLVLGYANLACCLLAVLILLILGVGIAGAVEHRAIQSVPASEATTIRTSIVTPTPIFTKPGVRMSNEMSKQEVDLVKRLKLAGDEEPVICLYNATDNSFQPELAVLTGKRISYIKEGRVTSMDLKDVTAIMDHQQFQQKYRAGAMDFTRFNVEIKGKPGVRMRVVITPAEDGPSFFDALSDAWKEAGGVPADGTAAHKKS